MTGMAPVDNGSRLNTAVRQARLAQAAHLDAVFDIRDAKQLRLVNLLDELVAITAESQEAKEIFDLTITQGEPPRLWVDATSYVVMEPDPRTFRFVRDVQDARETLLESRDRSALVERITQYMAHRLVSRERALAVRRDSPRVASGYSGFVVTMAWICGFAIGVVLLLLLGAKAGFSTL